MRCLQRECLTINALLKHRLDPADEAWVDATLQDEIAQIAEDYVGARGLEVAGYHRVATFGPDRMAQMRSASESQS